MRLPRRPLREHHHHQPGQSPQKRSECRWQHRAHLPSRLPEAKHLIAARNGMRRSAAASERERPSRAATGGGRRSVGAFFAGLRTALPVPQKHRRDRLPAPRLRRRWPRGSQRAAQRLTGAAGGLELAHPANMRTSVHLWYLALAVALAWSCDARHQAELSVPAGAVEQVVVEVETAPLRRGTITQHVSAPGSVVARRESRIGSEVLGTHRARPRRRGRSRRGRRAAVRDRPRPLRDGAASSGGRARRRRRRAPADRGRPATRRADVAAPERVSPSRRSNAEHHARRRAGAHERQADEGGGAGPPQPGAHRGARAVCRIGRRAPGGRGHDGAGAAADDRRRAAGDGRARGARRDSGEPDGAGAGRRSRRWCASRAWPSRSQTHVGGGERHHRSARRARIW